MTEAEAVQLARHIIEKLGIPLEAAFAEQEPQVTLPEKIGTNTVARYFIKWSDPRGSGPGAVQIEINGETRKVESLLFHARNLERPSPKVGIIASVGHGMFDSRMPPDVSPAYAWKLIPIMLAAIDDYAEKLSLPIPHSLTTNDVARVSIYNNDGWPHAEIQLTGGWRFIYRHTMVNGFYAPDNLFNSDDRKIRTGEFEGHWNLTTNQAMEVVRQAIAKLDYPTNNVHMGFAPHVYAAGIDANHIPRLRFEWYYSVQDELQSRLEAEVNMDNGKLESLYYDDKAYWNSRPPINVPVSIRN